MELSQSALFDEIPKSTVNNGGTFIPVENLIKDVTKVEQFANKVISYTSKYNISFSVSYSPENLVGKYVKYPSYGDFPETYILRSYGKWWRESESFQKEFRPQDADELGAEDAITLGFESPVMPRDVCIYETYNPGAVVRIWGRLNGTPWKLLWQGPPQVCKEESRKFHPEVKQYNCLINEVRLEFNQSHLKYHTSVDAVLLGGCYPKHQLYYSIVEKNILNWPRIKEVANEEVEPSKNYFAELPYEVVIKIFENLDLMSLSNCSKVNRAWYQVTQDYILYQNLSLKKYWCLINDEAVDYLSKRCKGIRKLDMTWCGEDSDEFVASFNNLIAECGAQLTHLSLRHCPFVNNSVLSDVKMCQDLTELRLRYITANSEDFQQLSNLKKLVTLDLCSTKVDDDALTSILVSNPNLKHVMIDFCEGLLYLDQIVETLSEHNLQITTWSSFKTTTMSPMGAALFSRCTNLIELDLGWCFLLAHPGDSLDRISMGCRKLKRLIISQWRGVNDSMVIPIVTNCRELRQLDLMGNKGITQEVCELALRTLPNLRLLDISFCDNITMDEVERWRQQYPKVTIQRSCQFVVMDYWN